MIRTEILNKGDYDKIPNKLIDKEGDVKFEYSGVIEDYSRQVKSTRPVTHESIVKSFSVPKLITYTATPPPWYRKYLLIF